MEIRQRRDEPRKMSLRHMLDSLGFSSGLSQSIAKCQDSNVDVGEDPFQENRAAES